MQPQYTYVSESSRADANAARPPTLNGITKAAWTNDETQTSFVIIFKLSHGIATAPPLPRRQLAHAARRILGVILVRLGGMAIDILSSDEADRCRSNFGSLILHEECRSKSDFDQHLAPLSKQLFLVQSRDALLWAAAHWRRRRRLSSAVEQWWTARCPLDEN